MFNKDEGFSIIIAAYITVLFIEIVGLCSSANDGFLVIWDGALDLPSKLNDLDFKTIWLFDFYFTRFSISTPNFLLSIVFLNFYNLN